MTPPDASRGVRRALVLFALIAAGEAVFFLPFVLARVFRPTFLAVFEIDNLELGTAFSVYGIVAMVAYFAGGPLADRFSARRLMATALAGTGAGGVVLAAVPEPGTMNVLWGFWGMTTILLFWSAMIRATREWGGEKQQGRAFGLLDGGRGLFAALVASGSVVVFAALLPDADTTSPEAREAAFRAVIWVFTGFTLAAALLVWLFVPEGALGPREEPRMSLEGVRRAFGMRGVWLQAIIVLCAYVAYKATDDFSLLARDALGYDEVQASTIGTLSFWIRAAAAIAAGYVGDRLSSSQVIAWGFAIMTAGSLGIASGWLFPGAAWMLIGTIVATSVGVYALRGVYFALLAEGAVPHAITGSAAGIVSVIGFTPDVFMGPVMGVLLDNSPGVLGHQHVFLVVALFGALGLGSAIAFRRVAHASVGDAA